MPFPKSLVLSLLLFTQSVLLCQPDSVAVSNSLLTASVGSQAVQFFLIGQATVAYKYHLSSASALRLSADISGLFERETEDATSYDQSSRSSENNTDREFVSLAAEYLYCFNTTNKVRFFLAGGPSVTLDRQKEVNSRSEVDSYSTDSYQYDYSSVLWKFGIKASAGIECHVYEFLSFVAQYHVLATYGPNDYKSSSTSSSTFSNSPITHHGEQHTRVWRLELSSIRIGASIYL
jgi:hypothetical protein